MTAILTLMWTCALMGFAPAQESPSGTADIWNRIRSFGEGNPSKRNPELVKYLKSLTAEEMLGAARQGCTEAAGYPEEADRGYAAELYVRFCLPYYFDKIEVNKGATTLLEIVADRKESPWLRRAIIVKMSTSRDNQFIETLQTYVEAHQPEVNMTLANILKDQRENALLRDAAMSALAEMLRGQVIMICAGDPNVRAMKERTHKAVHVGKMVRSGELTLIEDTWKALKPTEARILANAKLLQSIVAHGENEPETLRARARFMLELYERLPLTETGRTEIEKVLGSKND